MHALGDYGHSAEADLFMAAKGNANSAKPSVFGLMGRRFVVCSETEEGAPLASALMKQLTGGDPITARPLYGKPVTFKPSWTPLMVTNHLPKVKGNDAALWRRIRVIPFNVVIPEGERDSKLGQRLQLSADAILTWALAGYCSYDKDGMKAPEAVKVATEQYRSNSDAFGRFLTDRLDRSSHSVRTPRGDLWDAWVAWCHVEDVPQGAQGDFYKELEKHFGTQRSNGIRYFQGVSVLADSDEDTPFINEIEEK